MQSEVIRVIDAEDSPCTARYSLGFKIPDRVANELLIPRADKLYT